MVAGEERSLILKKVEPWNSVRVTFNIPADAAERLRELAQHPNSVLRELGVLAVQIGSDNVMSLSTGSNGSNADTKPSDVIAGSGTTCQAICQPTASVVLSSSGKTTGPPTDPSFPQFKVPTLIVPSCCPATLPSTSGAVRTITAVESPIPDVVPNVSVAQPRPVGLVRWPNIIPGRPGLDAVAVRFAVPPVPMKEFSQGLCFISPLRAAIGQNIASSSPLLVNLLQTQRQHGITAVPSQPVVPLDTGGLVLPQKRRRNTSTRKAKQSRIDQEAVVPVTSLQSRADATSHIAHTNILPLTTTFAAASRSTPISDSRILTNNEKMVDMSLSEDTSRARHMINPYTGNLELVDIGEDDGLSVSVNSSTEISSIYGSQPLIETAVSKSSALLNSDPCVAVSGVSGQIMSNFIPSRLISAAVKASELGTVSRNILGKSEDVPCTENQTMSTSLVSISSVSTSSRYVDWYTASQSDKHSRLQCDTAQLLFTSGLSGVKQPEVVESVKLSNIAIPSENAAVGSIDTKAGTSSDERCLSTVKPLGTSEQPVIGSLSKSSNVTLSSLESARLRTMSEAIPPQSSNFSTSCSAVPQLSSSQTDLIQMAFTLAKQNGSALHVSSLVDSWNKNAGLLQSSLQSLHGLHNIALATTGIPFHSSSTATTTSSCAQSGVKNVDGVNSTTTVVSSDTCFFPAVSCFPPEHRRKSAVSIGGFGINPEPQLQPSTSGVVSSLVSTLPTVKILTSASMPLEVKTCGISVVPSTVSNPITVNTSCNTESNSLPAGPLPNIDIKRSIPLLTNLTPTSWPLMPNLLTVPLVNPTPLSGSPLLHCVTRAPLTPDGKLAGLSAAVTNAKGNIVPLAGRFCIPLSSQAASVTTDANKQNVESTVVSGIRPHTIMLTDNIAKIKLSVSGTSSKSSGKHASSKERRGSTARTDDATLQRGSGKSHLTVAQLLDMAKNARLQQTACDDEQTKSTDDPSSGVTSASLQPQSALTISPLQLSSLPLQSSSVLLASHDQSQPQLVSVRLSSAGGSTASAVLQTSANPVFSLSTASPVIVSQSSTTGSASSLSSHLLAQPLNTVTNFSTVSAQSSAVDVAGKVSVESSVSNEYLALNTFSSSVSASLPMSAYSAHPPLPITSPRYPLNLTESVKKAMRGVGLYPSPPVSPKTPLQTFGSLKLPEIRPYPVSIACSVPVSELAAKKPLRECSTVTVPVMLQQQLIASNSTVVSCVNSCGLLNASVNSTSHQASITSSNCASSLSYTPVTEKQENVQNGSVVSYSDITDVRAVPAVTCVGSVTAADCIPTCNSLFTVLHSGAIRPEPVTTECSPCVSSSSAAVTCSMSKVELLSSGLVESLRTRAVSSHSSLKDGLPVTKTVDCLNGRLSASSGDSDMELRRDIVEGLSSIETDAGLSSLQSSPCSAELVNIMDSTKDTNTVIADNTELLNCVTAVHHRHSRDAVLSNAQLLLDSPVHEGSISLHCDTTVEDGYIKALSLASDVSPVSVVDVKGYQAVTAAADSVDIPYLKAAADSSDMSSKRNRLQTAVSNIGSRSTTRRKASAEAETYSSVVSGSSNNVESAGEQQTVTSVGSVTRMTTRSSRRTAASTTESANKTSINETKSLVQKTPVKSSERRAHTISESSNHAEDLHTTKSVVVTQRRSARTPVAKALDVRKSEAVTTCKDTDNSISLRSRRHAQKVNSVEAVTPRKRVGLRGTGVGKELLCLVDSTEDAVGVVDGSAGFEVNVNNHE